MIYRGLLVILCLLLTLPITIAVDQWQSYDPIVVRVTGYDLNTYSYDFGCRIPAGYSPVRTVSVRPEGEPTEYETQILGERFNYTFVPGKLYHVGCQTINLTTQEIVRGDLHLDILFDPPTSHPIITVPETDQTYFSAECEYQPSSNINLYWSIIHSFSGETYHLPEYTNQASINHTLPMPGLWDLICGVWDNERSVWRQTGLPIEFFEYGEAYLPNINGCMPWMNCTINQTENSPPLAPIWLEPVEGNENVNPATFKLHVENYTDPDGDAHVMSDFEIWDVTLNERVWADIGEDLALYRVEAGDGEFENSLEGTNSLLHETEYKARARFISDSQTNNVGAWAEWRYFRTREEVSFNYTGWDWTTKEGFDIERVAKGVNLPTALDSAPDHLYGHLGEGAPILYFTQLYGQIGVLLKNGSYVEYATDLLNYEVFGSLPGSGEMGVTGIYVDETTGDLFVSMVYRDYVEEVFKGKVDRFYTNTAGTGYTSVENIISEIPVSPAHQVHAVTRGPDGKLYLNTGDADQALRAQDLDFLGGKILRMNDDGSIPKNNPYFNSYVWALGFRNPFSGDWRPNSNEFYVSNNGPDHNDGMYKVTAGFEAGWCCDTTENTWHLWPNTVAPVEVEFNKRGTDLHESRDSMFVALSGETYTEGQSVRGKRIVELAIKYDGSADYRGELVTYTGEGFGTPIGIAIRDEGIYFTDIYGEIGFTGVAQTKGNIYRIFPGEQTSNPNEENLTFNAVMAPAPWYPQDLDMIWECNTEGGSENLRYDYYFGDGQHQWDVEWDSVYHVYPQNGTYEAYCTAYDLDNNEHVDSEISILILGDGSNNSEDRTPPVISNGLPTGILPNGTKIVEMSVESDEDAECKYSETSGTNFEDMTVFSNTGEKFHSEEVSVEDGKTYSYYVKCKDEFDNINPGDYEISFEVADGETMCYARVQDIPAVCSDEITEDYYDWCRHITCENEDEGSLLEILACNKPGDYQPTHFEMYKIAQIGQGIEICLGNACMSNEGFVSADLPMCV